MVSAQAWRLNRESWLRQETLKDEGYLVIKAYRFTIFEILRYVYYILCFRAIPTYV